MVWNSHMGQFRKDRNLAWVWKDAADVVFIVLSILLSDIPGASRLYKALNRRVFIETPCAIIDWTQNIKQQKKATNKPQLRSILGIPYLRMEVMAWVLTPSEDCMQHQISSIYYWSSCNCARTPRSSLAPMHLIMARCQLQWWFQSHSITEDHVRFSLQVNVN